MQFLVCSQCDNATEIEIPAVLKAMNRAAADAKFTITQPTIELIGLCESCGKVPKATQQRGKSASR